MRNLLLATLFIPISAIATPMDEPGFALYLKQKLEQKAPNLKPQLDSRLMLKLDGFDISLKRIFSACLSNAANCEQDIALFVNQTIKEHQERMAPPAKQEILLALRSKAFVERTQQVFKTDGDHPISSPFMFQWVWVPVLNNSRTTRTLSAEVLNKLNLSESELFQLAQQNLLIYFKKQAPPKPATQGNIMQIGNDYFASSRLLFPELWQNLASQQNNVLIVSAPSGNTVLYSADDSPTGIAKLKSATQQMIAKSTTPLSAHLLRWTETGWREIP